jgi:hypothetical protein
MAYIGTPPVDRFTASKAASVYSGDGSTVAFTLGHAVGSDEDILVSVDGVIQEPSVAYAVSSGTTLTFTAAPSNNAGNNIFVYYLFRTIGTVTHPPTSALSATSATFTGNVVIPNGGNIGSASDTDAISIASNGVVTFSQTPVGDNTGAIVQVVNVQSGTYATGTTAIPTDNTIPQNNEGVEFFTLAITPTSASSKLLITINAVMGNTAAQWPTIALFQDSTANALATATVFQGTTGAGNTLSISHFMTAETTSATTFKMRFGLGTTSTAHMNGPGGGALFGGTCSTSMTIMEIAV